jgi:hypothetical protein
MAINKRRVLIVVLVGFLLAACGGGDEKKDKEPASTPAEGTLTVEQDRVETRAGGGENWSQVAGTQTVKNEDAIRTDTTGHALLTFFAGTEVEILPGSELVVARFEESASGGHTITLNQLGGETLHRVARVADREDRYEVHTPSANLVVRGTVFGVQVAPDGATHVVVQDGVVQAQVGDQTFEINAGEALDVLADQTVPSTPYPIPVIRPPAATARPAVAPEVTPTPTPTLTPTVTPTPSTTPTATAIAGSK